MSSIQYGPENGQELSGNLPKREPPTIKGMITIPSAPSFSANLEISCGYRTFRLEASDGSFSIEGTLGRAVRISSTTECVLMEDGKEIASASQIAAVTCETYATDCDSLISIALLHPETSELAGTPAGTLRITRKGEVSTDGDLGFSRVEPGVGEDI